MLASTVEEIDHLLVAGLTEIAIELADCAEGPGRREAHDFTDLGAQCIQRLGGGARNRQHDLARAPALDASQRGADRSAGRDSVVDHQHRASLQRDRGMTLAIDGIAAVDFLELELDLAVELPGNALELGDHRLDLGDLAPLLVDLKLLQADEGFA